MNFSLPAASHTVSCILTVFQDPNCLYSWRRTSCIYQHVPEPMALHRPLKLLPHCSASAPPQELGRASAALVSRKYQWCCSRNKQKHHLGTALSVPFGEKRVGDWMTLNMLQTGLSKAKLFTLHGAVRPLF